MPKFFLNAQQVEFSIVLLEKSLFMEVPLVVNELTRTTLIPLFSAN